MSSDADSARPAAIGWGSVRIVSELTIATGTWSSASRGRRRPDQHPRGQQRQHHATTAIRSHGHRRSSSRLLFGPVQVGVTRPRGADAGGSGGERLRGIGARASTTTAAPRRASGGGEALGAPPVVGERQVVEPGEHDHVDAAGPAERRLDHGRTRRWPRRPAELRPRRARRPGRERLCGRRARAAASDAGLAGDPVVAPGPRPSPRERSGGRARPASRRLTSSRCSGSSSPPTTSSPPRRRAPCRTRTRAEGPRVDRVRHRDVGDVPGGATDVDGAAALADDEVRASSEVGPCAGLVLLEVDLAVQRGALDVDLGQQPVQPAAAATTPGGRAAPSRPGPASSAR